MCAFYLANESLSTQESILRKSHLGAEADGKRYVDPFKRRFLVLAV